MNGKQISSRHTKLLKNKLSLIIYVFISIVICISLINNGEEYDVSKVLFTMLGVAIAVFLIKSTQKQYFDKLADEILDHGEYLKITHNKRSGNLYLKDIININSGPSVNNGQTQVTIHFSEPFIAGLNEKNISFIIEKQLKFDGYLDKLIQRVDEARRNDR